MSPRFSIIIPAYNAKGYVEKALRALRRQTLDDYEAIVVDDGSTDGTCETLRELFGSDSRIVVFRQENAGPLIARRTAMSHARGEYAVFLDADDLLRDDALEVIADAIERTGADIVSFPFSRVSDFSMAEGMQLAPGVYRGGGYAKVRECVCRGRFNSLCGKAVRLCRIDMDAAYGAYEGLMHGEDLFQLLPIIDRCESLVQIEEPLYYYRDNSASSTSRFRPRQLDDIVVVNRRLVEYANKWGGACIGAAAVGEARQYLNLLKMSETGMDSECDKDHDYEAIRTSMVEEGVFERCFVGVQRIDDRILLSALKRDRRSQVCWLIKVIEVLKRAL